MATVFYPAIIERARGGFSVFFPDLPGAENRSGFLADAARAALAARRVEKGGGRHRPQAGPGAENNPEGGGRRVRP